MIGIILQVGDGQGNSDDRDGLRGGGGDVADGEPQARDEEPHDVMSAEPAPAPGWSTTRLPKGHST